MTSLDYFCIECGQQMPQDKTENILRKALGVLQEDGIYAMFLWLEYEDKNKQIKIRNKLIEMLNKPELKKYLLNDSDKFPTDFKDFCEKLKEFAQDLDKLFFMKKILERTLTYALYHAKIGEKK